MMYLLTVAILLSSFPSLSSLISFQHVKLGKKIGSGLIIVKLVDALSFYVPKGQQSSLINLLIYHHSFYRV